RSGQYSEESPQRRPAHHRIPALLEVLPARPAVLNLLEEQLTAQAALLAVVNDFRKAEETHRDDDKADAVSEPRHAKGKAGHPRVHIAAHDAEEQPHDDHAKRLQHGAGYEHGRADEAE